MATKSNISQPLDCERLLEDCDDEQSFVNRCLQLFVRDAQKDINAISAALEQNDCLQIVRLAHRIKGASASIRADFLKQQAARLEVLSSQKKLAAAAEIFCRLREEFDQFRRFVETLPVLRD